MTPLRQRMIEDMQLRNLAPATQRNYIAHVASYASYFWLSPEVLDQEAVRQYLLYLLNERKMSPEGVNQQVSALKFLYLNTLEMPWSSVDFPRVKRPYKLPVVLSHEEVIRFFDYVPSVKYRAALMICYGAGLRVSEAVAVKVSDIDSQRGLLRVEQGKGRKDRYAMRFQVLAPNVIATASGSLARVLARRPARRGGCVYVPILAHGQPSERHLVAERLPRCVAA